MPLPRAAMCDTSVVIRFVHDHADAEQQATKTLLDAWLDNRIALLFLDLGIYEFVNVLVRGIGRSAGDAADDTNLLFDLDLEFVACDRQLALNTARTAAETGLTAYDAAFVSAARMLEIPLVTADKRIVDLASDVAIALRTITAD